MSARAVSARAGRARRDNIADESYADGEAPVIATVPKSDETIARIESALEVRRALCIASARLPPPRAALHRPPP